MQDVSRQFPESAVRVGRDLRVVISRIRRRLREETDPTELTPSQLSVLTRLGKEGPLSASDLAAVERVKPQSIAAIVGVLHNAGLIGRQADPNDGRRQLLSLTEAGRGVFDDSRRRRDEWLTAAVAERYTEAERCTIAEALVLLDRLSTP